MFLECGSCPFLSTDTCCVVVWSGLVMGRNLLLPSSGRKCSVVGCTQITATEGQQCTRLCYCISNHMQRAWSHGQNSLEGRDPGGGGLLFDRHRRHVACCIKAERSVQLVQCCNVGGIDQADDYTHDQSALQVPALSPRFQLTA
jgi:hypothetical protein